MYDTGNPPGSFDPRDLFDNSVVLDQFLNSSAATWLDRLGIERKTLAYILSLNADLASNLANATDPSKGAALIGYEGGQTVAQKLGRVVDIWDFSPKGDGSSSDVAAFTAAAAAAGNNGLVRVRKGVFLLDSLVPGKTNWDLDLTATITGQANLNPGAVMNTSYLQGMLYFRDGNAQYGKLYYGPPQYNIFQKRNRAATLGVVNALAPTAHTALNGMVMSSLGNDTGGVDQSCIAVQGLAINDNTATPKPVWAGYFEGGRYSSGTGPYHGIEIDTYNGGNDSKDFNPYIQRTIQDAIATGLSCGAGGGGSDFPNQDPISCYANFGANGNTARRGLVVLNGALSADRELFATYARCGWKWYWPDATAYAEFNSFYYRQVARSDTDVPRIRQVRSRATGATVTATAQFDAIGAIDSYAFNGTAEVQASFQQIVQRSSWSNGKAQTGWQLGTMASDGTVRAIELNNSVANAFHASQNNQLSLGAASYLWTQLYAATATINTSDERFKEDIRSIDERALDAWSRVEFMQFKMKDAVAEKGDSARWHFGVIAQRVKEAFEAEGLDPFAYGILCHDSWDAQEEIIESWDAREEIIETIGGERDENHEWVKFPETRIVQEGREAGTRFVQEARPAGDRYGVRYEEALVLECALMRREINKLKD